MCECRLQFIDDTQTSLQRTRDDIVVVSKMCYKENCVKSARCSFIRPISSHALCEYQNTSLNPLLKRAIMRRRSYPANCSKLSSILSTILIALLMGSDFCGLKVAAALKGQNPRIIEHPMDMVVPKNGPFTFNCKAEGNPKPSIHWFKDDHELKTDAVSHRMFLPTGGLFFLKVVHSRRESDAGTYWCQAKNEFGVARSRNATLQVAFLREEFRLEPQNTRVAQGEVALMECGPPRGSPEPQVFWRKNGQTLNLNGNKRIRIVDGGNLAIQDARLSDDGRYQCVVKNPVGIRESFIAFLKVHMRPFLIRGPQNQTAVVGSSVIFQCRIGGDPLPDVLWRRTASGGNMPLRRVVLLEDRSLKLLNVTLDDMGEYTCEADNEVGSIMATGILTVHAPPKFVQRPKNQLVEVGDEVIFECQATGFPKPTVYWSLEGNSSLLLAGYKDGRIEVSVTPEGHSVLSILRFVREDSGKVIVCNALNAVGSVSSRAIVTVNTQNELPPPIIEQGPVNQTLPLKSFVTLPCRTVGVPVPQIQWYLNGIQIDVSDHEQRNLSESGALTIVDLQKTRDEGLYTCVATNRNGKSSSSGYLRLDSPTNPNIKFYRAPELSTHPGPPGKPQILEKTEDSVSLTWTRSNKVGGSSLVGYVVEMFAKNETDDWTPVATRLQNTTYTQVGLQPGVNYFFLIRAENSHGLSLPSSMSEPITVGSRYFNSALDLSEARASLLSGDVVELINASVVDSTSMKLSWQIINGKYVEGFYIYGRQLVDIGSNIPSGSSNDANPLVAASRTLTSSSSSLALISTSTSTTAKRDDSILQTLHSVVAESSPASFNPSIASNPIPSTSSYIGSSTYRMLTILNGGGASSCTMTGLQQYTLYEFFIVPFYKTVEGKPSNSRVARTLADVPNEAPYGMEAVLLNSSAVFLKWKAPEWKDEHGVLLNYHVVVRGIDTTHNYSRILTNVTIDAASPTLVLANLTEGVMYTVSVAAGNNAGLGPYCAPATLRLDPVTKRLDPFINQRYPINQQNTDDVLTQPWFIILLGAILAIMMLSLGAMVFVKRRHMMIKQSALNSIRGSHAGDVLKMPSLARTGNGYWLDASTGGMVWRATPTGDTIDMQKDQIDDYSPVCLTNNVCPGSGNSDHHHHRSQQRYIGEYSNIPTDYAEVSSFGKNGNEYSMRSLSNSSPAPYATSAIMQQQQQGVLVGAQQNRYQSRPQHNVQQQQSGQQPMSLPPCSLQSTGNNIYQQMSTNSDIYPTNISNRSTYSDQYYYPKEKIHITENKLSSCHTYEAAHQPATKMSSGLVESQAGSAQHQHLFANQQQKKPFSSMGGTLRQSDHRLKPGIALLHSTRGGTKVSTQVIDSQNGTTSNNSYNTGDLMSKNLMDLDAGSFCYNGLADSGCGGSPSPIAMLMSHEDDTHRNEEQEALYHTADGDTASDIDRFYVKVNDSSSQYHQEQSTQQKLPSPQHLKQKQKSIMQPLIGGNNGVKTEAETDLLSGGGYTNWHSHSPSARSALTAVIGDKTRSPIAPHHPRQSLTHHHGHHGSAVGDGAATPLQQMHVLHQQQASDSEMIYAPGGSMASERSLLSNSGSSTTGGGGVCGGADT